MFVDDTREGVGVMKRAQRHRQARVEKMLRCWLFVVCDVVSECRHKSFLSLTTRWLYWRSTELFFAIQRYSGWRSCCDFMPKYRHNQEKGSSLYEEQPRSNRHQHVVCI